jgi:hypothetical protein
MDKAIIGILLIAILAIVSITSLSYYIASQSTQTSNDPSRTPTPTSSPTITPDPTAKPELSYDYVVYEWHLKAEYINNIGWLSNAYSPYDVTQTWRENYIAFLSSREAFPSQASDSIAAAALVTSGAFVDAEFNQETGWSKATYKYYEFENVAYSYTIETALSGLDDFADDRGWTKTFV